MGSGLIDFRTTQIPKTDRIPLRSAAREVSDTPTRLATALMNNLGYMIPGTGSPPPLNLLAALDAQKGRDAKDLAIFVAKQWNEAIASIGGAVEGVAGAASKLV